MIPSSHEEEDGAWTSDFQKLDSNEQHEATPMLWVTKQTTRKYSVSIKTVGNSLQCCCTFSHIFSFTIVTDKGGFQRR